ncbi:MAG: GGDEF domain-containing protein [Sphingobium sp.]|nr:GGDEF domain-containing protein [Sphingobium sp.]
MRTVDELRNEITALRRELRLLRIANSELERVAIQDTLTPLFNRRYFLNSLQEQLARARRYNNQAALLFIDVNRMKHINDRFGHSAGDYALVHVARIVESHIRSTDIAARIGGDEFAMILEAVDEQGATAKAEQLSAMLHSTPCLFGAAALPVSVAIGITMLRPNDTQESLMDRADADMYARKRAWHSRQEAASGEPPLPPHHEAVA